MSDAATLGDLLGLGELVHHSGADGKGRRFGDPLANYARHGSRVDAAGYDEPGATSGSQSAADGGLERVLERNRDRAFGAHQGSPGPYPVAVERRCPAPGPA